MTPKSAKDATQENQVAWNANRFAAWQTAFGSAQSEADKIRADPAQMLRRLSAYLSPLDGQKICNVQGSHGRIAVAMALLGAHVHVIDFSRENEKFACALAAAAGVSIEYSVCDVMQAEQLGLEHQFDTLVLELGILHYHQDLEGFFAVMRHLAKDDGRFILNEFHPVQRKLFWPDGPQNYFETGLVLADVPNPIPDGPTLGQCAYRFWTMGDIVNAIIKAGFTITQLDEHPAWDNSDIPGTFTLVAQT